MIGTHTPKAFNAKLRQGAVRARILGQVPRHLVCSQTVHLQREAWALPRNAADMAAWRLEAPGADLDMLPPILPPIEDGKLKQLLLPLDNWKDDRYLCVTPVTSCGLMHELWQRLGDRKLPYRSWLIQPTPAAIANHGEALLAQAGRVRLLTRGAPEPCLGDWRGDFVMLEARVERMNISGGMVSVGWPAMTAIGGLVHAIERETGQSLEFAFGMRDSEWVDGLQRINNPRRVGQRATSVPGFSTEEIVTNARIALLVRGQDPSRIAKALRNITRVAGGAIFDVSVRHRYGGAASKYAFLRPAEHTGEHADALDAALALYSKGGEWIARRWWQPEQGGTLNMTGYALLEQPIDRQGARSNYPHAWAEPVFTPVIAGPLGASSWWRRTCEDWGCGWTAPLPDEHDVLHEQA